MGKVTVKVRNTTSINVKIQEGNAGLFVTRATLFPNKTFSLELDPNATYREYVLIRLPDNTPLQPMFSSDDVAEYKEIVIKEQAGEPKYCWEGIYRGQKPESPKESPKHPNGDERNPSAGPAVADSTPAPHIGWFQKLRNLF
ncbi:hypothetical protein KC19_12G136400 [Ceratodon purpureus]|uniref:DUF7748 domain-containing protein n=1 Tax=Ceratodon purpureus TaxID=3225 RepID=A0A8T0G959_CERPU|nr:hypothetical protein KC19_12G136400 [Ceratodon purpureus]